MKTDQLLTTPKSPGSSLLRLGLLASLCLGVSATAFAKKGGGGKPGGGDGGGEDPPADPPPYYYQVSWITPQNAGDTISLRDVSPDGTVVGSFLPGGAYGSNIALIEFPDGTEIDLEELLQTTGLVPSNWRVPFAFRICDDLLLHLDIYDETERLYCGALKLNPDRSIAWFTLFGDPNGDDAFLLDASESGDFLIATGDFSAHSQGSLSFNPDATLHVWTPSTGATVTLPGPVAGGQGGWYSTSDISDYPAAVFGGEFHDLGTSQTLALPSTGTDIFTLDVGAEGTVVALIPGEQIRKNKYAPSTLARWNPGASEWETLLTGGGTALVGGSGQVALNSGGDLFVFDDTNQLQPVNDMIDPAQAGGWNPGDSVTLRGLSNPAGGAAQGGVILGENASLGAYFILTPVTP